MKKKLIAIALVSMLGLTACGNSESSKNEKSEKTAAETTTQAETEEETTEADAEAETTTEAEPEATGKYAEKSLTNELSELKKDEPDSEEDADDVVLLKQGEAADLFAKAAQENEEAPQADEASVRQ